MTSDRPSRHSAFQAALLALCAAALLMSGACNKAGVVSGDTGGNGGGGRAGANPGDSGSNGGNGGINLSFGSTGRADAGTPLPTGGNCGDSIQQASEQCDDGNKNNGDGCSRICQIEGNWVCPEPGKPCKDVSPCGSGVLTTNKVCDDGNNKSGDGCSSDCKTVEPGFICRVPGKPCAALTALRRGRRVLYPVRTLSISWFQVPPTTVPNSAIPPVESGPVSWIRWKEPPAGMKSFLRKWNAIPARSPSVRLARVQWGVP